MNSLRSPLCESHDATTRSIGRNFPSYLPSRFCSLAVSVPEPFSMSDTLHDTTSRDRS